METLINIYQELKEFSDHRLFSINGNPISLWTIVFSAILILFLVLCVNWFARLLENRILARRKLDEGMRHTIANLFRYIFITIGAIIIISSSGIDMSVLTVLLGTLGVGIGFGLQGVTGNFISGIIILFERPIKVGDRIEIGNTSGDVMRISTRATTILTNDNIAIIVPNSDFINKEVINWSYNDRVVRFKIPIGVAYNSDVRLVEKLLLEVAKENKDVLNSPEPVVRFISLGEHALNFEIRVWTTTLIHRQGKITSDLNFAIFDALKKNNIEIPFPQMEVRIKNN